MPEPFGPTIALIPGPNVTCVRSANDLKPWSRTDRSRAGACGAFRPAHPATSRGLGESRLELLGTLGMPRREDLDRLRGGGRLGHSARSADAHPEHLAADLDLDPEDLVVIRADGLEDAVGGPPAGRALRLLLEAALRALEHHRRDARRRSPGRPCG